MASELNGAAEEAAELSTLASIRRFLLGALFVGVAGMGTELLLIGHVEGLLQLAPVVLLGLGLVVAGWHAWSAGAVSARVLQTTMVLFVISGLAGVILHYRGNVEFELEMYPTLGGIDLVRETLTGATPVLAPGSMTLLGLVGLVQTYRHPRLRTPDAAQSTQEARR